MHTHKLSHTCHVGIYSNRVCIYVCSGTCGYHRSSADTMKIFSWATIFKTFLQTLMFLFMMNWWKISEWLLCFCVIWWHIKVNYLTSFQSFVHDTWFFYSSGSSVSDKRKNAYVTKRKKFHAQSTSFIFSNKNDPCLVFLYFIKIYLLWSVGFNVLLFDKMKLFIFRYFFLWSLISSWVPPASATWSRCNNI